MATRIIMRLASLVRKGFYIRSQVCEETLKDCIVEFKKVKRRE
jgi:hypothetical protein